MADDLDSFSQTLIHALLFRGGKELESVPQSLFSKLGVETVHYLKEWRDETEQVFWRISERVKKEQMERERENEKENEAATGETGGNDEKAKVETKEPEGLDAMAEALYKLLDLNARQWWKEQQLARVGRQGQEKERTVAQYEGYRRAMGAVKEAAEAALKRKEARKAEKRAQEETVKRDQKGKSVEDAVQEVQCEQSMKVDQEGVGDGKRRDSSQGESTTEPSSSGSPPKKRTRTA